MADVHVVLGGAASGKSALAVSRARALGADRVTFIATARPGDPELDARIAAHRRRRPASWPTVDAGGDLAAAVGRAEGGHVLLIDSLTLWVAAALEDGSDPAKAWVPIGAALARRTPAAIVVTDEVGQSVVPETAAGRRFRDALGAVNQLAARDATTVTLVVAGVAIPLRTR